ncbi:MAG: hypothetical protein ACUVUC_04870 [Thermoguttaceae bacterium]
MCRSRLEGFRPVGGAWLGVLVVGLVAVGGMRDAWGQGLPPAADKPAAAPAPNVGTASLTLKRVVLFSSGVGYFEHTGQVRDTAKVEMHFKVDHINDLLKSMVVQDLGGGQVSTVGYGSKDPIDKTLKSFAIDLTSNPTMGKLLIQIRGEKVELDAPSKIVGTIVGVETRKQEVDKGKIIEVEVLNLLTDDGLRSVVLESVSRIKLVDEKLNAELQKALAVLATAHATDKKTVTLNFQGEGERQVRVGYILETPIWKTSYRLVLEDGKAPFLQGWAIVENTTEEDWTNVGMTLVSGRPISFVMDLYQPLYVARPKVKLELYASLRPQTYEQDLAAREEAFRKLAQAKAPLPAALGLASGMAGQGASTQARAGRAEGRPAEAALAEAEASEEMLDIRQGVQSAAAAGEVGELFQYAIATPVTLPRRQSAMLPIVNREVKGQKLSIYNPQVHPKHPLNGLKLTNSTELHLMQGPITVFDDGVYAGDAKIQDLPPGSQRLLSYAMDLDIEVAPESKGLPEQLVSVRLVKGTMFITRKHVRTCEYTIKNSGGKPKKVLIEYPYDPTWTLVNPKEPAEKTRDMYRFAVEAKPGEPAKLAVEEERIDRQEVALINLDEGAIQLYLGAKVVSDKVKAALQEMVQRKHALAQLAAQQGRLEAEVKTIDQDQARIRQNMRELDRTSELYKRYVTELTTQEDKLAGLRGQIKQLTEEETKLRKALDEFLMGLELE